MTIQEVYDFLKQYIDAKVKSARTELQSLFTEYKTKEVGEHLDDIKNIRLRYVGAYSEPPTTRYDGSELQPGDFFFDTNQKIYRTWDGSTWCTQYGGLYADANKGIAYIYTKSNPGEIIHIPENTNGYSVDSYIIEDGAKLIISSNSVYKIL
jgi:hypothetical protein